MLPEKWQIEVTTENEGILGKWRDAGSLGKPKGGYIVSLYDNTRGYWFKCKQSEYEIISFEDFKRYILKEQIPYSYEIY